MKIDREVLLSILSMLKPALASKELVTELTHIWFTGEFAVAYNDSLAIEVPMQVDFEGGVRGNLLLGWLDKCGARSIDLEVSDDGAMRVKGGRAEMTTPLLAPERAMFEMPVEPPWVSKIDETFLSALADVMPSIGNDSSIPEQLGVTFLVEDSTINMFSTDSATVSWRSIQRPKGWSMSKGRVTIPSYFCTHLLKLCKDGGTIYVGADSAIAINKDNTKLFTRLVEVPRPRDFLAVFDRIIPQDHHKKLVPVPPRLRSALDRASLAIDGKVTETILFTFDETSLRLNAKSAVVGIIKDDITLDKRHGLVKSRLDPKLIRRGLERCDSFMMTREAMIMTSQTGLMYIVSSVER